MMSPEYRAREVFNHLNEGNQRIVRLIGSGMSNKEIHQNMADYPPAGALREHISRIYRVFGCKNRLDLTLLLINGHVINPLEIVQSQGLSLEAFSQLDPKYSDYVRIYAEDHRRGANLRVMARDSSIGYSTLKNKLTDVSEELDLVGEANIKIAILYHAQQRRVADKRLRSA